MHANPPRGLAHQAHCSHAQAIYYTDIFHLVNSGKPVRQTAAGDPKVHFTKIGELHFDWHPYPVSSRRMRNAKLCIIRAVPNESENCTSL